MTADTETVAYATAQRNLMAHEEIIAAIILFDAETDMHGAARPETRTHLKQVIILANSIGALPDHATEQLIGDYGLGAD